MRPALIATAAFAAGFGVALVALHRDPADAGATGAAPRAPTVIKPVQRDDIQKYSQPRAALNVWEGCRHVMSGVVIGGPVREQQRLTDGRQFTVSLVPERRDNGTQVFDALISDGQGSVRTQLGFAGTVMVNDILLEVTDTDLSQREVSGEASYVDRPHPDER